jgi:hypothetical protein
MISLMRTTGAAIGAQLASALLTARSPGGAAVPLESGFTLAFALGAAGLLAALLVALLLEGPSLVVRAAPQPAPAG